MPKEYIYEPWTAPLSVQEKARCIIGKDYPKPGEKKLIFAEAGSILQINTVPGSSVVKRFFYLSFCTCSG
jgi:hypothetical protein